MNLPSGIHFRTVAPMIIKQMKLWDARSPHIDRASDLGYKVTQKTRAATSMPLPTRDIARNIGTSTGATPGYKAALSGISRTKGCGRRKTEDAT